jgi:hypothetical protein
MSRSIDSIELGYYRTKTSEMRRGEGGMRGARSWCQSPYDTTVDCRPPFNIAVGLSWPTDGAINDKYGIVLKNFRSTIYFEKS